MGEDLEQEPKIEDSREAEDKRGVPRRSACQVVAASIKASPLEHFGRQSSKGNRHKKKDVSPR